MTSKDHFSRVDQLPVFDRAHGPLPTSFEILSTGAAATGFVFGSMRNRAKDKRPPRSVATPLLMGDPAPDRVVPDIPPETGSGWPRPASPILLTFRDLEAAKKSEVRPAE